MKKNNVATQSIMLLLKGLLSLLLLVGSSNFSLANPGNNGDDVLDKKISIIVEQKEVKSILAELSKLAEIKFVYSSQRIPCKKKVSLQVHDKKLSEVLNSLFIPLDVLYYVSGSQIVLMKKGDEKESMEKLTGQPEGKISEEVFYKTVTGKVTNEKGEGLSNVSVLVKGTGRGTTTGADGSFSINAEVGETLQFSMIGYTVAEAKVTESNSISMQLVSTISNIDEVVVVGYGTQLRRNVTGAVTRVTGKTLNELPVISVPQALQGRVPGVQVTNNGSPGTAPIVRIRGISSISFASDPLYVVDGFPTGDLASLDMRDVESVDVLKDASAAAIYGSRATSGVIMITTKKGSKSDKVKVNFNSYYGVSRVTKRLDLLNTQEFMKYALAYRGTQVGRLSTNLNDPIYPGATQTYGQTNTDWQDEFFKDGQMTQTNIGLSGGNDISRFYAGAGYLDQRGTTPSVGNRRYNFRLNSEHNISKVFTFGETLYTAFSDQAYDANEQGTRSNLVNVIRIMPHIPVYDPTSNGGFHGVNSVLDGGDPTNPVEDAKLKNKGNRTRVKVLGTGYLDVAFTKWLKFRSTLGIDYANGLDYRFQPIFNDGGTVAGSSATQATVTNNRSISTVLLFTNQLTFDKSFGKSHVNAIAVVEQQSQKTKNENGRGNQPSNDLKTLNNALNQSVQSLVGENSLISYLGRINYEFDGKYLLSAAVRRDGLSVWAPGKKWGTFPSASVGWRIDQESFMRNQKNISELKLRGGYGETGINGVLLGNTVWLASVSSNSSTYPFNNSVGSGLGSSIQSLGNKDLEWEITKQVNVGLDLGLFKNKITLTAEYFNRNTENLILNVTLPPSMGFINSTVAQNIGAMRNKGFELQLGYNEREHAFKWNATANLAIIRNKVTKLAPGVTSIEAGADQDFGNNSITNTVVGQPIQSFYGWVLEGIFQNAAEVTSHAKQVAATAPGDLKFADLNKDGKIDNNDRTFLGSYLPKFTYAFNLGANYKNFDAGVFFQGVSGNKIYNATKVITEGMIRFFSAGTAVLNAWTPTNTNTNVPRAITSDPNGNARTSARFLENGSFLRMQNVMLGYNVPGGKLTSMTKGVLSGLRIYLSAQNLITITDYSGYDPEVGNRTPGNFLTNGIDFAIYPQPKSVQVGIQANF
jgi:TonB-linked SusC/RagA family outer membrane protein